MASNLMNDFNDEAKSTLGLMNDFNDEAKTSLEVKTSLEADDMGKTVEVLLFRVGALESAMTEVIEELNSEKGQKGGMQRDMVTQMEFDQMVVDGISSARQDFGVSKLFIRKCLKENYGMEDNRYVRRRLNACLKRKIESNVLKVDGALYSLV